ncbi:hypothetical protein [Tardiphaga sp.]|uniref:hypothetical protein n=1 Tax=Tardiphaga sp. TaxID=1926292 RepID=UPI003529E0A6
MALALGAHVLGADIFALNELIATWKPLITLSYEPNPYKALLSGHASQGLSSLAIELELLFFLGLAIAMGWLCEKVARVSPITARADPLRFGWLLPIVQKVEAGGHVAVGYVRTTSGHDGAWIAYEGSVRRLTLDEDDGVRMVVLEQVELFEVPELGAD